MSHTKQRRTVAGIGELLWDISPNCRLIGGAPANFAWHCLQLGAKAYPVSCIGNDAPGIQMRAKLWDKGVDTSFIIENHTFPTGVANVNLDQDGKASFEIVENAAWDHLVCDYRLKNLAAKLDAVCFGSLSQRSIETREAIRSFILQMPDTALKIFDVNLRQSYHSKQLIEESLQLANILKLSDEELGVMATYFNLVGDTLDQLRQLLEKFDLRMVAFTRGAQGSLLLSPDEVIDTPGLPGEVVDSIGAGDSFTAALCMGLLNGWSLEQINPFANKVAAFVCSQKGATPELPSELLPDTFDLQPSLLTN